MQNFERRLTTVRNPTASVNKNKRVSSDNNYYSRKKYTITDESLKKTVQPRRNTSLPKYIISTLKHKKSSLKTIEHTQPTIFKNNKSARPSQINLDNVMDPQGNQLSATLQQGITLFHRESFNEALEKFKAVEAQVGGLSITNSYWLAICFYELNHHQDTIRYMTHALNKQYSFTLDDYLKLYDSYRITGNYLCAINMLNKCINEFGQRADLLLKRARIHVLTKNYSFALTDYELSLKINPGDIEAQIEKADMIYFISGINQAQHQYDWILAQDISREDKIYVSYRKALLLLQENKYREAMSIFKELSPSRCPKFQSQINYYKGVIESKLGNDEFALLSYQQSINSNTSRKFATQAQYQKIMIMLRRKDYYGAEYELERVTNWSEDLKNLNNLVEGIMCILKMRMKKGVERLAEIRPIKGFENLPKSFRAYGFFMMRQYQRALLELKTIQGKLCSANLFNRYVIEATLALEDQNFNKCLQLLDLADKVDNWNTNVLSIKAICHISLYNCSPTASNRKILLVSEDLLVKVTRAEPQNDSVNYLLGLINYQLENYEKALDYVRTAIEVSEQHKIKHYYLKAHSKINLKLYKQAINDISNILIIKNDTENRQEVNDIQTQQVIRESYLYRAECYILTQNFPLAEEDLTKFFSNGEAIKKYHQHLYLFMHVGACDTLMTILEKMTSADEYLVIKMKCYFLSKELNNCLKVMSKLAEDSEQMEFDMHCLRSLRQASTQENDKMQRALDALKQLVEAADKGLQGNIFTLVDCLFYCGVVQFQMADYSAARQYFIRSKNKSLEDHTLRQIGTQSIQNEQLYGNCIYFLEEIDYNIGLTYLMDQQLQNASVYLAKYQHFQQLFNQQSQQPSEAVEITPFPIHNRLCSVFDAIQVQQYLFRLSFCLPQVKLPPIQHSKHHQLIKSVSINDIPVRPNPPWINKNEKGIIFTGDINKQSIDLKSEITQRSQRSTPKELKQKKQKKQTKDLKHPKQKKQGNQYTNNQPNTHQHHQ